jgi:Aromatic-ring-opening dioxygenase LigAB, LigA subunit
VSRYEVDKALWQVIREPAVRAALRDDPERFFEGRDVTDEERRALQEGDIRALYTMGAIPFLIYQFALGRAGGFSIEFAHDYVGRLAGCEPADIAT